MGNNSVAPFSLLFECSWEVCNKIGGIYTVLSTKAHTLKQMYKDKVIFIGPDVWSAENPSPWFTESRVPSLAGWAAAGKLPEGVSVRIGRWEVPGRPIAILVKWDGMMKCKDQFYGEMWQKYGVDSLHAYGDYDEGCTFSLAAGAVIESIVNYLVANKKLAATDSVITLFNEWTTAMGLLYVKSRVPQAATIFTTHATSIGRSICGNGKPLYDYMKGYNGDQMAQELNMQSKHSLEKAAAHQADCFTTVSEITARECEQLLERRPDVVTPNGFEKNFVPAKNKFAAARAAARKNMLNVAAKLTGDTFDNDTFILITSGRCEYRNKGLDLFLDSCDRMRSDELGHRVLAYVMVPAWCRDARQDLRQALDGDKSDGLTNPVITHNINNPESDPIYNRIHQLGFNTRKGDKVTVIYVPCYLNGNDGIFNATYYDLLIGADATAFPSYYEPWGYTPLESVAFGVPTITTSLSGFGQWILEAFENYFENCGVNVIGRGDSNYSQVAGQIASAVTYLTDVDDIAKATISAAAQSTADAASWTNFIRYYVEAFEIAEANRLKRQSTSN
ncbi:MAG: glycosyltransferase [Lachnoclostridium sp.]|nr:glycosyltransferase [Lachnoclostridium sp.]